MHSFRTKHIMPFASHRQEKHNQTKAYLSIFSTFTLFICVISISSCDNSPSISSDWWNIDAGGWTQVYFKNSTLDTIFSNDNYYNPISVGTISHIFGFSSELTGKNESFSFNISRRLNPLLRITFKVLQFPVDRKEVVIDITEGPAGVFGVVIPDSSLTWIEILDVKDI